MSAFYSQHVVAPTLSFCEGSLESVQATVKELEENLKEGIANSVGSSLTKLSHAKVVGIACDVCEPHDVQRLADFAVKELGYVDIWVSVVVVFVKNTRKVHMESTNMLVTPSVKFKFSIAESSVYVSGSKPLSFFIQKLLYR